MPTNKQIIGLVNEAFWALPHLSGNGWGNGLDDLAELAAKEERQHRNMAPSGFRHPTTVASAARLMVIYDLARALKNPKPPTWSEVLSCRKSWLLAAGLADRNSEAILKAWAHLSIDDLCALDYSDFVKGSN